MFAVYVLFPACILSFHLNILSYNYIICSLEFDIHVLVLGCRMDISKATIVDGAMSLRGAVRDVFDETDLIPVR